MACSERHLFYALLVFWFVGVMMLIIQHPYDCKFFDLPPIGSGRMTPTKSVCTRLPACCHLSALASLTERLLCLVICSCPFSADSACRPPSVPPRSPHQIPEADAWFRLTHRMTLTPYAVLCVLLQLALFFGWYAQMAGHSYLLGRVQRETERGRAMRQYGWGRCLRSVFRDSDHELQLDLDTLPPDAERCECVCGCCALFSTNCALWLLNALAITLLVFMLLFGVGSLESANRFNQNPSCRAGLPAGYYIFSLNVALLLLYLVLLVVRAMCSAGQVVTRVVEMGKRVRNRVQTRKGLRANNKGAGTVGGAGGGGRAQGKPSNPSYAQLDATVELGLELSDDENENENENENEYGRPQDEDGQMEMDQSVADSIFGADDDDDQTSEEEFHAASVHVQNANTNSSSGSRNGNGTHAQTQAQVQPLPSVPTPLAQPKPHRPAATGKLLTSPPSAAAEAAHSRATGPGSNGASAASIDADTRDMLEMLDVDEDEPSGSNAAALQQQAEDALRELEEEQAQFDAMP